MQVTLVNDWYMSTDTRIGTSDTSGITAEQIHNAEKVYAYFSALGWSLSAIAGMLGNMQVESYLSPAYIQSSHRSSLPNSASSLSDVPNSVMINFYGTSGYGVGLVQWDGYTNTTPAGQKLVSFAERYGLNWYDGDTQLFRIKREKESNIQWQQRTINGTAWTWNNYVTNNETPETSAKIWQSCYEIGGTDSTRRQNNARYWYDYFQNEPEPPADWVSGEYFANLALAYDGQYIPYSQWDCITFVQAVWHDIPTVNSSWVLCSPLGTNTLWRMNETGYPTKTFNTTSPFNQNPTPVLWYKDTISNCEQRYGSIPTGALLFHKISEAGPPAIPAQYAGDGIGNFAHVGIYCGNNEVMQSGGRDSGNIPGGGVHKSAYDPDAWNYVAFVVYVDSTTGGQPEPEPEPHLPLLYMYLMLYTKNKKGVLKNVKRFI